MAVMQTKPSSMIDVQPYGAALATVKTSTLFKTDHVKLIRIVMHTGQVIPLHQAPGEIIVQCLEGRISFTAMGKEEELGPSQMLYLEAGEPHAVRCLEEASLLLTVLLRP